MQTERQDGEDGPQYIDQIEIERNKMIQRLAQDREPELETDRGDLRSRLNESKTNDTVYCEDQSQLALLTDDGKTQPESGGDTSNRNKQEVAKKQNIISNKDRLFKMFGG